MDGELRSDVRRRRDMLLAAAAGIFLEQGITAPLDLVTERAGLGRATLYRHFPDRTALVLALLDSSLDRIAGLIAARPETALRELMAHLADELIGNAALADAWRIVDRDLPALAERRARFLALCDAPLSAGLASGELRADLTPEDMPLLVAVLGTVVRERTAAERRAMAGRLLDLVTGGLLAREPADAPA